jgi:serpin B
MLTDSFNALGLRLFRRLSAEDVLFLSPLSIAVALSAVRVGAKRSTGDELASALGPAKEGGEFVREVSNLIDRLTSRQVVENEYDPVSGVLTEREADVFRLNLANGLFIELGYPLLESYVELLRHHFKADVTCLDFSQPDLVAGQINEWISERTEGKITSIIDPSAIQPDTRAVLVNGVYFMAQWLKDFDESDLRYVLDAEIGFEAIEIPYRAMSMLVILPARGRFHEVEGALEPAFLDRVFSALEQRVVKLQLPKFEMSSSLDLCESLRHLGIDRALDAERADLSGISSDPDGLFLSDVIHCARIRVNERGTEAAAATAVTWLSAELEDGPEEAIPFVVDRPFFFLIRDEVTGAILFLGRMLDPRG